MYTIFFDLVTTTVTSPNSDIDIKNFYIEAFLKCHKLVHDGVFPIFEALNLPQLGYSLIVVNSTEISENISHKVQSSKSLSLEPIHKL